MAGEVHGSKAVLKIQNAAGVLTKVAGGNSADLNESIDTAETSSFEDTAKGYIPGLEDATISLEANYTSTNRQHLRGIKRMTRNFEYFPAGEAVGQEKLTGALILTSISRSSGMDGAVSLSCEAQISGGVAATEVV